MNNEISQGIVLSTDNNNISSIENYKPNIELKSVELFEKYIDVVSKYISYFRNTIIIRNNVEYYKYILIKGVNTICHVFRILFLYTKNIELVIHHCEKSFFYYIEFIKQIDENNHNLLSLNSNDASYFVYKKTIYEINHEYRKKFNQIEDCEGKSDLNSDNIRKINNTNKMIDIYNRLLVKISNSTILLLNRIEHNTNFSCDTENEQIVFFQNKMNKLSTIILQYLNGENENDERFVELINVLESFVFNYKNTTRCIVPYIDALLKKIKKRVGNSDNTLVNSSEILNEISKRIQKALLFIENDDENSSNNFDSSLTPSKYIKLLIWE